jgi:hypothetical protein
VLSSLAINQASFLLAPKTTLIEISHLIRDFLWKGGKGNQRKFHLVSWETVKSPIKKGGLQIRDPGHANIALGQNHMETLLKFQTSSEPNSKKKYLQGKSMRNLHAETTSKGTLI